MGKRLYTVTIEREITFQHQHRVLAASEEAADRIARDRVTEGDWFGGDVIDDMMRPSQIEISKAGRQAEEAEA